MHFSMYSHTCMCICFAISTLILMRPSATCVFAQLYQMSDFAHSLSLFLKHSLVPHSLARSLAISCLHSRLHLVSNIAELKCLPVGCTQLVQMSWGLGSNQSNVVCRRKKQIQCNSQMAKRTSIAFRCLALKGYACVQMSAFPTLLCLLSSRAVSCRRSS